MHRATWEQGKDQACGDRRQAGRSKLYCVGRTGVGGKVGSGAGDWGPGTWFQNGEMGDGGGIDSGLGGIV